MKDQNNLKISYAFDKSKQKGLGICVCEGRYGKYLPGRFSYLPTFLRRQSSCMVVMCRTGTKNAGIKNGGDKYGRDEQAVFYLLKRFQNWFQKDLPPGISDLDADVVKCYWQEFIEDVALPDGRPPDVAAFLIHNGHYIFFNTGDIQVYEYGHSEKTVRRWPTCQEREQLDGELGIGEKERQSLYFKCRRISKRSIFLIVPDQIQTVNPKIFRIKRKREKWIKELSQLSGTAVMIGYGEG